MSEMTYQQAMNILFENNQKDHEYTDIERHFLDALKACQVTSNETLKDNMYATASNFETAVTNIWKLVYLIPMYALEDTPEKWVPVKDSPLLGKEYNISKTEKVLAETLELHADTIDGSPSAIYRINGNSALAFMLYGNTIVEYDTKNGEDLNLRNTYSCACFVNKFPFVVPFPTVTTVIYVDPQDGSKKEMHGFVSDIRMITREEYTEEELKNRFFSPQGTSLYPTLPEKEELHTQDSEPENNTNGENTSVNDSK